MATQIIHIKQDFAVPAIKVFNFFSDHNRLPEIWPGPIKRIRESDDPENINGVGSARLIGFSVFAFEETVEKVRNPDLIEYTISKGSPIKNHYGVMKFIDNTENTSHMDYQITLESKIPFTTCLLKFILQSIIGNGVRNLAKRFKENPLY